MKFVSISVLALTASALFLSACNGQQNALNSAGGGIGGGAGLSKSDIGTGLGAATGAVIGSSFGRGNGRVVGGVLGALAGAGLGSSIGSSLDRADMTYYDRTAQRAFETGQPGQTLPWRNTETGNSGSITPKRYYQTDEGRYCREFNQKINVGGKTETGYGTACRQEDGSWEIVSQ